MNEKSHQKKCIIDFFKRRLTRTLGDDIKNRKKKNPKNITSIFFSAENKHVWYYGTKPKIPKGEQNIITNRKLFVLKDGVHNLKYTVVFVSKSDW